MYKYFCQFKVNHLFFVFLISFAISSLLPYKFILDYSSYESIYDDPSRLIPSWEPFFVFLNRLSKSLGLSYDFFRLGIKIFGAYSLYQVIMTLRHSSHSNHTPKDFLNSNYLLVLLLPIFMYEYFSVRIRVGLAICFLCFGLIHLIKYSRRYSIVNLLLTILFVILAFFTHKLGTVCLLFLCFVPLLLCILNFRIGRLLGSAKVIISFLSFLIVYTVTNHEAIRGYNLPSELNLIRLLTISVFPVLIFLYQRNMINNTDNSLLELYAEYFSYTYVCLGIALFLFFIFDSINNTGEAIVRVFTLATFAALIITGSYHNKRIHLFTTYLGAINQLFFLNTLKFFEILF